MSDLISRREAIDAVRGEIEINGYSKIIDVLRDMPSAQPRWIPCSERLPEAGKRTDCLVTVRHKNPEYKEKDVCYGEYDARNIDSPALWRFETERSEYDALYVTAWMPLPEPYDGGRT